jgi:hypothetical protein
MKFVIARIYRIFSTEISKTRSAVAGILNPGCPAAPSESDTFKIQNEFRIQIRPIGAQEDHE